MSETPWNRQYGYDRTRQTTSSGRSEIVAELTNPYNKLALDDLVEKHAKAVAWLKANKDHPKFFDFVKKYHLMYAALRRKQREDADNWTKEILLAFTEPEKYGETIRQHQRSDSVGSKSEIDRQTQSSPAKSAALQTGSVQTQLSI